MKRWVYSFSPVFTGHKEEKESLKNEHTHMFQTAMICVLLDTCLMQFALWKIYLGQSKLLFSLLQYEL